MLITLCDISGAACKTLREAGANTLFFSPFSASSHFICESNVFLVLEILFCGTDHPNLSGKMSWIQMTGQICGLFNIFFVLLRFICQHQFPLVESQSSYQI